MRLDRNTNTDGSGKYALVKLRKLHELLQRPRPESLDLSNAWSALIQAGVIHFGTEGPGEQFFVMKYKDKFTAPALKAYTKAVCMEMAGAKDDVFDKLFSYGADMMHEALQAESQGNRIPD